MNEPALKQKKPESPQESVPVLPQTVRMAVIDPGLMQQVIDLIRDEPLPRKKTDPIWAGLQRVQYAEFPVGQGD